MKKRGLYTPNCTDRMQVSPDLQHDLIQSSAITCRSELKPVIEMIKKQSGVILLKKKEEKRALKHS